MDKLRDRGSTVARTDCRTNCQLVSLVVTEKCIGQLEQID